VARHPIALPDILGGSLDAFTALSRDHKDGWGIAYSNGSGGLTRCRESLPAWSSPLYARLVGETRSDAALLHLRKASPGLRVGEDNTHPFVFEQLAFGHNGRATLVDAVESLIDDDLRGQLGGQTDSERYLLAVISAARRTGDIGAALLLTATAIRERAEITALNCLLLSSTRLYALACYDAAATATLGRPPDFFELLYSTSSDLVFVGSTGWPAPGTDRLVDGQLLEVDRADLRVTVRQGRDRLA